MKKQLPTYVPKYIVNFVKPRLNNFVLELMENNQSNLFTTPSTTTTDDLLEVELKIKLYNKMYQNRYLETHEIHQWLRNILIDSMSLYQENLNAQDTKPTLKIMPHDHRDPPNDRKGRKENHPEWFSNAAKKSGLLDVANRKPNWFDTLLNSNINQDKTVMMGKKIKEILKKDELTIADLEDKRKNFFKEKMGNMSTHKVYSDKRIITIVSDDVRKNFGYSFLMSIKVKRIDNKEYEFNYADLLRLSLNDIEDMYLLKVQESFTT
nr:hypothetical protein [Tanacetum cinerariifolium]